MTALFVWDEESMNYEEVDYDSSDVAMMKIAIADQKKRIDSLMEFERGWAKPHVWNFIAKTLRENYPQAELLGDKQDEKILLQRRMVENIALAFTRRFEEEDGFEPTTFLTRCSPDEDLYPFAEMWEL